MAFTGTFVSTPVTELVGGELVQWGSDTATVEAAYAPERQRVDGQDMTVVPLIVLRSRRRRPQYVTLPSNYVLLVRS